MPEGQGRSVSLTAALKEALDKAEESEAGIKLAPWCDWDVYELGCILQDRYATRVVIERIPAREKGEVPKWHVMVKIR